LFGETFVVGEFILAIYNNHSFIWSDWMPPYFPPEEERGFADPPQVPMDDDSPRSIPGTEQQFHLLKMVPCGDDDNTCDDRRRAKRVTFNMEGQLRLVECLGFLTPQEKSEIWMTMDDYNRTQEEAKDEFRRMNCPYGSIASVECCFSTGIESLLRYEQRRGTQAAATRAVLQEQLNQRQDVYSSEDLIAMVYEQHSEIARNRAYLAGVMMQIESRK
jgi:hypothetical protein